MSKKVDLDTLSADADAFVVVHHPKGKKGVIYGIGPFPPMKELRDFIVKSALCECHLETLWVRFPPGISMAMVPSADIEGLFRGLIEEAQAESEGEARGPIH